MLMLVSLRTTSLMDEGTLFYPSGEIWYVGEWKAGIRSGHGIEYNKDGSLIYEGEFKNGKPVKREEEKQNG